MIEAFRRILPIALAMTAVAAHGQVLHLHGASISVGGTGQFSTQVSPETNYGRYTFNTPAGPQTAIVSNQQQYTTNSAGFVTSFQFHPVAWAGVELNYGYTHYSERFAFNNAGTPSMVSEPVSQHEATGAYSFHPRHIPFQPFVNIGGGAIDFNPAINALSGSNQIRGAGLLEMGFDLPTRNKHIGFRVEGRALAYRAPNFYTSAISTTSWRVTEEPSVSTYYRF